MIRTYPGGYPIPDQAAINAAKIRAERLRTAARAETVASRETDLSALAVELEAVKTRLAKLEGRTAEVPTVSDVPTAPIDSTTSHG